MSSHPASPYGPPAGHPQHPVAPFGPPAGQPERFPGQGELVLHLRKPPGLGSAAMISPVVTIDGYPAPAHWETNHYPVPPGVRTVCVESQYLWRYGRQQLAVQVPPGQRVEVHYTGPLTAFGAGAMGYSPQPRPGKVASAVILSGALLLIALAVLMVILGSAAG